MTKFAYVGFDRSGKQTSAVIESASETEARETLRAKGLFVTEIKASANGRAIQRVGSRGAKQKRVGRVRVLKTLMTFTRQLHVLITSGTPLVPALAALERQTNDAGFKAVLAAVRKDVEEGISLSVAMQSHPLWFDDVCRSLIAAGEAAGHIEPMLDRLARLVRSEAHVRTSITGALIYPAVLILISIGVMSLLLTFVLPRFAGLFLTLGSPLPPTTKFVMAVSDFLRGYWWAIALTIAGIIFSGRAWKKTPTGRSIFDSFMLKAPVLGKMTQSFCTARVTRLLGIQLESKVPLLEALGLTRNVAGNVHFQNMIIAAEDAATKGQSVSSALAASNLINPTIVEAIRSGEQTGQMAALLVSISDFLDEENEVVLRSLTSLIEPLILVVLGIMVGAVAISMFLPLFDLTATTAGGG